MTVLLEGPSLTGLTDHELAAMFGGGDDAAILAELARRDESDRRRAVRRGDPVAAEWRDAAYAQYLEAERVTCGNLVRRDSPVSDGWELWSGPERWAFAHATEELRNFWLDYPRMTVTQYRDHVRSEMEAHLDEMDRDEPGGIRPDGSAGPESEGVRGQRAADAVPAADAGSDAGDCIAAGGGGSAGDREPAGPARRTVTGTTGETMATLEITPNPEAPAWGAGGAPETWEPRAAAAEEATREPAAALEGLAGVSGAATLDAARDWLSRFVSWPSEDALNLACVFALGAHCTDRELVMVHAAYPRLIFTGAKNSGKTFAMEQVLSLCPRPDILGNTTAPSLAKQIATEHSTIGLDEMDLVIGNGTAQADLRNLLNLSYKRSGAFRRVAGKLPVFCPLAMTGLATVLRGNACLDTLRSRSVIIDMVPAEPGAVERYRSRLHEPGAQAICAALASWGEAYAGEVADAWPELPDGIVNRDEEIATPLLAIAEVVGGEWPRRIRQAVKALIMGESAAEPTSAPAERILADIAAVWTGEQIGSGDLAVRLACLKGAPWRVIFPDPARAGAELAEYLRPHGITPVKVWLEDLERHAQGYTAEQFT